MEIQLTKGQVKYLEMKLAIIDKNRAMGKKEEVPHLSESTKKQLGLIGYV